MKTGISTNRTKVNFEKLGAGPSLIIIGNADDQKCEQLINGIVPFLAPYFTVFHYLRRTQCQNHLAMGIEQEIAEIAALIAASGSSAYLFGISSGAALAVRATESGLPILKLAIYEPQFSEKSRKPPESKFKYSSLVHFIPRRKKRQTIELFMKTIGIPRTLLALMGLLFIRPAMRTLAPNLIYDTLIMKEEYSHAMENNHEVILTTILSGQTDLMKDSLERLVLHLPKTCHEIIGGQNLDIDPWMLSSELASIFYHPIPKAC